MKYSGSARFMASLLLNLVDNLVEEITKLNVKIVIIFLTNESFNDN